MRAKVWHRRRQRFRLDRFLAERFVFARQRRASRAHLAAKHPQIAVFAFDYIGDAINREGVFEHDELETLFAFLAPLHTRLADRMALDVGANIGNHALAFAGYFAEVHAFEPNPRVFRLLEVNATLARNVRTFQLGIGAARETRILRHRGDNLGEASAVAGASDMTDMTATEIPIESLDARYPESRPAVGLIKIDVEGMEAEVLAGAGALLTRDHPLVVLEQRPHEGPGREAPTIETLRGLGYRIFLVERHHWGGNALYRLANLARQMLLGTEHRVVERDPVPPGYHPMILAVPTDAAATLAPA